MNRRVACATALAFLLTACSGGASGAIVSPAATPSPTDASTLVPLPDWNHQPSFATRSGRPPQLSLQELFHPTYNVPLDPANVRTLLVTGDIIPARGVNYFATARHDFLWPFRPTAAYTKNADITYINLEAPLFSGCPVSAAESFTFCGDARFVNGLTYMGADVANLANNHLSNYGAEGITATQQLLNKNHILTSGLGPVAVIDVRGLKLDRKSVV